MQATRREPLPAELPREEGRDQKDRAEIDEQRKPAADSLKSFRKGEARLRRSFELRQSFVDQVEPNM